VTEKNRRAVLSSYSKHKTRSSEEWSRWEKVDPALKRTYEGAPAGTGAIYS